MIFVDANIFLRRMAPSATAADEARHQIAIELFRRADEGEFELTTSEAVLAEVVFILTAKIHYGLPVAEAVRRMLPYVRSRGLTLDRRSVVHDALLIWRDHPALGFVDALGAAYGSQPTTELATFDVGLSRVPGVKPFDLTSI